MAAAYWAKTARRMKRPQVEPALEPRALQYAAALYRIRQAHVEHLDSAQRRGSQPEFPITPPQLVRLVHFFPLIPPQVKYLNLATFLSRPAFAADYQFLSPLVHCEKPKEAKAAFFAAFPALKSAISKVSAPGGLSAPEAVVVVGAITQAMDRAMAAGNAKGRNSSRKASLTSASG